MAKLKIFIGFATSATNNKTAKSIIRFIKKMGHKPVSWNENGLFKPGDTIYNRLIELTREHDGAIFIFSPDDLIESKNDVTQQPRDNVLIEFGLFSGALGSDAVCFCRVSGCKIAVDLGGIIYIDLPNSDFSGNEDAQDSLEKWIRNLESKKNVIPPMAKIRSLDSSFPLLQLFKPNYSYGKSSGNHTIYALSDSCKNFFVYDTSEPDETFFGKPAKSFIKRLENYVSPPKQYWTDLTTDQKIVYSKLRYGGLPLARVPVYFNNDHDYYPNTSFVPIIVQREKAGNGEVMTILYLASNKLPRSLFVENVWQEISNGIELSILASELTQMAIGSDVTDEQKEALTRASEEAKSGGGMQSSQLKKNWPFWLGSGTGIW